MMKGARNWPRHNMHVSPLLGPQISSPSSQMTMLLSDKRRRAFAPGAMCSPRDSVVHVAGDGGGHHRQIGLGRLAEALEGGRLDPANAVVPVLEPADAELDDRIHIRLGSLHS